MKPGFGTHGMNFQQADVVFGSFSAASRVAAVGCVLLLFLASLVSVAHFHANDSAAVEHSCSLCALAHAGITVNSAGTPTPVFGSSFVGEAAPVVAHSLLLVSSHYIRPPPQA
jgi:hypothetical protein